MGTMHGIERYAQFGIIGRAQVLTESGLDKHLFDYRVRDGELIPVHRGVYRFRGAPDSWESRAYALTLLGGEGSALSHFTAAWMHGLDGFRQPERLDLLVPCEVRIKNSGAAIHRTREPFGTYRFHEVIRATNLARTLIDLASVLPRDKLEAAVHAAWRKKKTIRSWVRWTAKPLKRNAQRGLDTLLSLLGADRDGGCDSDVELQAHRLVRRAGLPLPEQQHELSDSNGRIMRVDNAWPTHRVLLHVDSVSFHGDPAALARDARQRNRLEMLGWRQLIVTKKTLRDRAWLQQLANVLRGPPVR